MAPRCVGKKGKNGDLMLGQPRIQLCLGCTALLCASSKLLDATRSIFRQGTIEASPLKKRRPFTPPVEKDVLSTWHQSRHRSWSESRHHQDAWISEGLRSNHEKGHPQGYF